MRQHLRVIATMFAGAGGAALALPASSASMQAPQRSLALAGPVTVSMSGPASAKVGDALDYTITLSYTGELTGPTDEYTVTYALQAGIVYQAHGISAGTCSAPPVDQGGTLSCAMRFSAQIKSVTINITAGAADAGTVMNTAQLSTGDAASVTTTIGPSDGPKPAGYTYPAPPGSVDLTLTGPETVKILLCCAPPRFGYTLVARYNGPPLTSRGVRARFTARLPQEVRSPGLALGAQGVGECVTTTEGVTEVFSCNLNFTPETQTLTNTITVRPTTKAGAGTSTVDVSTGGTASWTTTFIREEEPPQTAPAPVAGPPAAPTKTVVETFSKPGETESVAAAIAPTTETVQIAVTWGSGSSFDVTGIQLVPASGQALSVSSGLAPQRLKITKRRTARYLDVRIKGVKRGTLRFKIVAKKLHGRAKVVAKIRQSKR